MRPVIVLLLLFVALHASGAAKPAEEPKVVDFRQLIDSYDKYDGQLVRVQCVMNLFGEGTHFTQSGLSPDLKCDLIELGLRGVWEQSAEFVELRRDARRAFDRFRQEHPKLSWPEVEAQVDLVAIFCVPQKPRLRFTLTPVAFRRFQLLRIVALDPSTGYRSLLRFPIQKPDENRAGPDQPRP